MPPQLPPKSSYDKLFFDNVLSSLEGQEGFSKEVDRVRAVRNIHRLRDAMEKGDVSRVTFFDRLTEIFAPDIGVNEGDADANLAETAFHAKEFSGQRGAPSRKENVNPQFPKRKVPAEEMTTEIKLMQDLKSEFGNMRTLMQAVVDHFGIACKKRKSQDEPNNQGKAQAALANSKAGNGKSQKASKSLAVSFPRKYVDEVDSDASESEYQTATEHAMFTRVQMQPLPKLTVQSIYGPNSRRDVVNTKSSWDCDRFGFYNPRPRSYEEDIAYAKRMYDLVIPWDDDRCSTASSKSSLAARAQCMSLGDEAQTAKKLELSRYSPSPHSEQLLSEYRKHLEHCEDDQDSEEA